METSSNFVEENSDDNSDDFLIIFEWNDLEKLRESTRILFFVLSSISSKLKLFLIFASIFHIPRFLLRFSFFFFLKNP